MTAWHEDRLLALDTETTVPDPESARIVQYALAWVGGAYNPAHLETVVDPGVEIPEEAAAIHGITTERAQAEGLSPVTGLKVITDALRLSWRQGWPVVGHNIRYDLTVVDREVRRHLDPQGLEHLIGGPLAPVVDTLVLSKQVAPYRRRVSETQGAHVLKTCVQALIPPAWGIAWSDDEAHGALYDALMSARVAVAIARTATDIGGDGLQSLHRRQVQWCAEQAASLQAYLRSEKAGPKQDVNAVVSGVWPVAPPEGVVS